MEKEENQNSTSMEPNQETTKKTEELNKNLNTEFSKNSFLDKVIFILDIN